MANDTSKVYSAEVIPETPFPQSAPTDFGTTKAPGGTTYSPQVTKDQPFPTKRIAQEVMGAALNTKARKILGSFTFTKSGAVQIGDYEAGISGDVRISPDGITARDKSGNTTFALDGDTGDAVFSGDLRAATFENDNFTVDREGNVVANSIKIITQGVGTTGVSLNQIITSGTEVDITNTTLQFTLVRPSYILILVDIVANVYQGGTGNWAGNGVFRLNIGGVEYRRTLIEGSLIGTDQFGAVLPASLSMHFISGFSAGNKTIKVTGAADQVVGTTYLNVYSCSISYIILGNT